MSFEKYRKLVGPAFLLSAALVVSGCNEALDTSSADSTDTAALDEKLHELIVTNRMDEPIRALNGASLPDIETSTLAQLGKKLFFSKSLGGDLTVSCATCHHPTLYGADELSFPIGTNATAADQLGLSRRASGDTLDIGRNTPTVFNAVLWADNMFWDGRVESVQDGISTPDSALNQPDASAGTTLLAAQARFPTVTPTEMLGNTFAESAAGDQARTALAERLGGYGAHALELPSNDWLSHFQQGFGQDDTAENLITFANITEAIGEYERTLVFINSPWQSYLDGDDTAMSAAEKRGAIAFMSRPDEDGADCVRCHKGPLFSDQRFGLVAFPQFGVLTDEPNGDIGREGVTSERSDRYRFRTPSLLNVAETGPYGHAGSYASLEQVMAHYDDPRQTVEQYFTNEDYCDLPQLATIADCATLFPDAERLSLLALTELEAARTAGQQNTGTPTEAEKGVLGRVNLSDANLHDLVAFMGALSDPCLDDELCLAKWIAEDTLDNPDGNMLKANFSN